jgi:hypothetical protein
MNESQTQSNVRSLREANGAMITHAVTFGFGTTERALQSALEVLETTRRHAFQATIAALDWVETLPLSPSKVTREALGQLDKLSEQLVTGTGEALLALTRTARSSCERAGEVVAGAAESMAGMGSTSKAA